MGTSEIFFYWSSHVGSGHDHLPSNTRPEDKGVTQYVETVVLASLFPGYRGKAEPEYGLVKKF